MVLLSIKVAAIAVFASLSRIFMLPVLCAGVPAGGTAVAPTVGAAEDAVGVGGNAVGTAIDDGVTVAGNAAGVAAGGKLAGATVGTGGTAVSGDVGLVAGAQAVTTAATMITTIWMDSLDIPLPLG